MLMNILKSITDAPSEIFFSNALAGCRTRKEIPETKGFTKLEFSSGDGTVLRGWKYKTPGKLNNRGTCFIMHGFDDNSQTYFDKAMQFSKKHNVTVMAFDHRHHGLSETRIPTFGCYEAYDVQAAMDYADKHKFPKPYILHGTSLGGLAAQRAGIEDKRVSGIFLVGTPGWPWDAIGNKAQLATPAGNFINLKYGWDVLNDGNIMRHKQPEGHYPFVCSIIGTKDDYGVAHTKKVYKYWHQGKSGVYNKFPSETPNAHKWFWEIEDALHPGPNGYQVWDWEGYDRLENEFINLCITKEANYISNSKSRKKKSIIDIFPSETIEFGITGVIGQKIAKKRDLEIYTSTDSKLGFGELRLTEWITNWSVKWYCPYKNRQIIFLDGSDVTKKAAKRKYDEIVKKLK